MMLRLTLLLTIITAILTYQPIVDNYTEYLRLWGEKGFESIDVTHLGNQGEKCEEGRVCVIRYFVGRNQGLREVAVRNRTLLVLGSFQGNDYLASTAVLNLPEIQVANVIYFPVPNPSGFVGNSALTFPTGVDPSDDFPLLGYMGQKLCNRSSAVKVLDHIFRTHRIDLTIQLKQGPPSLSHSWTNIHTKQGQDSSEYKIYDWIVQKLNGQFKIHNAVELTRHYSSYSYKESEQMKVSRKRDSFVDWAYGASKYPEILVRSCNDKEFELYPSEAMNGLSLVLSIGTPQKMSEEKRKDDESSIFERTGQLVTIVGQVLNPTIPATVRSDGRVSVSVKGCRSVDFYRLRVYTQGREIVGKVEVGAFSTERADLGQVELLAGKTIPGKGYVEMDYSCGKSWEGMGKTMFAKVRQYTESHSFQAVEAPRGDIKQEVTQMGQINGPNTVLQEASKGKAEDQNQLTYVQIAGIVVVVLCVLFAIFKGIKASLRLRQKKGNNFSEKFEKVEYMENTEQDIVSFSPRNEPSTLNRESNPAETSSLNK